MKIAKLSDTALTILRKRARHDKTGLLGHLITCYETLVENTCDPNSQVLEFKPEIIEALEKVKK